MKAFKFSAKKNVAELNFDSNDFKLENMIANYMLTI